MFGLASEKDVYKLQQSVENLLEVSKENKEYIDLLMNYTKVIKEVQLTVRGLRYILVPEKDNDRSKINAICEHLGIKFEVYKQHEKLVIVKKDEVKKEKKQ